MMPDAEESVRCSRVFLAYNSRDEKRVEAIAYELCIRGVRPWFAKWHLHPGEEFLPAITAAIAAGRSVAVFIGPAGLGKWQQMRECGRRYASVSTVASPSCRSSWAATFRFPQCRPN